MTSPPRSRFAGLGRPTRALLEPTLRSHRPSQLVAAFGALAGIAVAAAVSVVLGVVLVVLGIVGWWGAAVWHTASANRVLIAKGLQQIGIRHVPGFRRFEDRSPRVGHALARAWEGHETRGLGALQAIAADPRAPRGERADATLALADWYLAHGQPIEARRWLDGSV